MRITNIGKLLPPILSESLYNCNSVMARPSKQKERQPPKDPFVNVTSSQAKREKGTLSARSVASQLYIKELKATKEQEQTIHTLYSEGRGFDSTMSLGSSARGTLGEAYSRCGEYSSGISYNQ